MNRLAFSLTTTVIAAACLLSNVRPAAAQAPGGDPASAAQMADAKRLFDEGQQAYQRNDFPAAEAAFEASYKLSPTYDTATNLGMTEMKQGKWREAAEHLDAGLRAFPVSESVERRQKVEAMLIECKLKLVTLRLNVNVPGAKVEINGESAGTCPLPGDVYADPGTVTIKVSMPGYEEQVITVQGTSRLAKEIAIELVRGKGGGDDARPIWPAIVLGIAGAGGIGAGIGLIVAAKTGTSGFDGSRCPGDGDTCPQDVRDAADQHNVFMGVGIGAMIFGALAVGGMGLYLGLPGSSDDKATALQLVPIAGPDSSGILLRGRW